MTIFAKQWVFLNDKHFQFHPLVCYATSQATSINNRFRLTCIKCTSPTAISMYVQICRKFTLIKFSLAHLTYIQATFSEVTRRLNQPANHPEKTFETDMSIGKMTVWIQKNICLFSKARNLSYFIVSYGLKKCDIEYVVEEEYTFLGKP